MPKSAQDLINQYREVLNPNKNQVEYRRLPDSRKVNENLPDQLTRLSQSLAVAVQNVNIPGDFRARLTDQQQALETLTSQIISDQPDMNEIENALNTLGGLGDLLAEPYGPDGRTLYDDVVSTNQSIGQDRLDGNLNALSSDLHLGIDTQRLHDHQPMVHEVWENEAFSTGWNLRTLNAFQSFVPNNSDEDRYTEYLADDDGALFAEEFDQADYGVNGLNTTNPRSIHFEGQYSADSVQARDKITSREKVAEALDVQRSMSRTLSREQSRRSDERTKRYYGDLAYVTNPDNGNYMEAAFRTPYTTSLINMIRTLAKPDKTSSAEQKMDLGLPLYEASYDLFHSAMEEIRVQYNRQRLEKQPGGWTQEKENEYLRDLKAAHEQTIRNFDNFAQFDGLTDGSIQKHFREKDLSQTVAKNLEGEKRYKDVTIGELRGEVQAMNNGWSSNELSVLGMIGAMEASAKVYGKLGTPQQAAEVSAFRDDLEKLKQECFHTKVTTTESKRLIANRVKQFMDSHQRTELQREIMSPVKHMKGAFDKAHSEITTAAAKELHNPINPDMLRDTDPAAYLRDLEQKAVRSGNFSVYAAEVADMFAGKDNLPQDQQQALDQYWGTIQQKAETDPGFIRNFADAMAQNQVKAGAALEQAKQEMAGAIRDGREPVDPMLGDVRHIPEAARLIAGQKLESSEMARQLSSAKNMTARMDGLFAAAPLANYAEYVTNAEKAYANDRTDGLSAQEKNLYLNLSKEEPGQGLQQFGVQQTKDPQTGAYTVTQAPTKQQVLNELQSVSAAIGTGMADGNDYRFKMRGLHTQVSSQNGLLQRLETLQANRPTGKYVDEQFVDVQTNRPLKRSNANSGAFMNMVDALKKVNDLSEANSTPLQVSQALENLDKAAEAYQQKIAAQGIFGAWTGKGQQRLEMAGELREFVRQQRSQFNVYANGTALAPNEKIGEQYTKINIAIDELNREIQVQNQAQQNQNQVNNVPVNNAQQPAGEQPNAEEVKAPAQPKKGGVKEFATLDDFMQSLNTKQRPHLEEPAAKGQQRQRSSSIHRKQPENKPDMNPSLP